MTVYWQKVLAPIMRSRKEELGGRAKLPDREIAISIADETGIDMGRAQVNHWFKGRREPNLVQFVALCQKLKLDPGTALLANLTSKRRAAIRIDQRKLGSRKPDDESGTKSRPGEK